jgi:DNA-binding XRE family transcriptional regulator
MDFMTKTIVEIMGTRFVLIPEAEFEELELPAYPPVAKDGTSEARSFVRASIARTLIKERRKHGLTQVQLAKLAGIRQETISRLESGKHRANPETWDQIEKALKRHKQPR